MTVKERIAAILREVKPTKNLEEITDIVEGGYIDSFELMTLITELSEQFGIEITIDEISPENFNSIDAICSMIESLQEK